MSIARQYLKKKYVTSSKMLYNFTVNQMERGEINILSVFNDTLLVSCANKLAQLFIMSHEGHLLSTVKIKKNMLLDATWTPHGNIMIVYNSDNTSEVVLMSRSGEIIITHSNFTAPFYLSVSTDDVVYLAEWVIGVYQSEDGGVSWSLVFNSDVGWHCVQVFKVTNSRWDDLWTLEIESNFQTYHLRTYNMHHGRLNGANGIVTGRVSTATNDKNIYLPFSTLSYDGKTNIFLTDYYNCAVHVLSTNSRYYSELLYLDGYGDEHCNVLRLSFDKDRQLLYVGQIQSALKVFKLSYLDEKA